MASSPHQTDRSLRAGRRRRLQLFYWGNPRRDFPRRDD